MSKGDYVQVVVDTGMGQTHNERVTATKVGGSVTTTRAGAFTVIYEKTRSQQVLKTLRFRTDKLILETSGKA